MINTLTLNLKLIKLIILFDFYKYFFIPLIALDIAPKT